MSKEVILNYLDFYRLHYKSFYAGRLRKVIQYASHYIILSR